MAYRLDRGESVIRGLKRVVRGEMESAGSHLYAHRKPRLAGHKKPSRDEAIHEARKSIKKIRAILRLVRAELGETQARENARLRDLARRLSAFRDAFAIIETFDGLKDKYRNETRHKLQSVRAGLAKRRNEAEREEDVEIVLDEAVAALRKAARRVKGWPLQTDGYAAIGPGLEETFRAGRKALARAGKDPRAENFHELRKRVKDHWYHMRLLEGLWTGVMNAYEKSLKDLETWLGDDHNLAVLRDAIVADPALYGRPEDIELTLGLVGKSQKKLRHKSLSLARRIYNEKPREFTRRVKRLWDAWRHEPHAPEKNSTSA
jgi:CHAD domain-containing protein